MVSKGSKKKAAGKAAKRARVINMVKTIKKARKASKKKTPKAGLPAHLQEYANLIADPCNGPLVRGVVNTPAGGSMIERQRTTLASSTTGNGYIVWFPSYTGDGNNPLVGSPPYTNSNLFIFEPANTALRPTNTVANPLGLVSVGTTGLFNRDPAYLNIIGTSPFTRARCLSACIQAQYVGPLSSSSGQMCSVANVSINTLNVATTSGSEFTLPSVDEIFAYAAERGRLQLDGVEVKYRPTINQDLFRSAQHSESGSSAVGLIPDSLLWGGNPTASSTQLVCADPANTSGIIIAWRGVPTTAGSLAFNLVKVSEFELAARGGAIEPLTIKPSEEGKFNVGDITSWLDRNAPGWQRSAVAFVSAKVKSMASAYMPDMLMKAMKSVEL